MTRGRRIRWLVGGAIALVLAVLLAWLSARTARGPRATSIAPREPPPPHPTGDALAPAPLAVPAEPREPDAGGGAEQGAIFGRVSTRGGASVDGAHVVLHDEDGTMRRAEVGPAHHRADELAPGTWWLTASAPGFRTEVVRVADLAAAEERRVDVALASSAWLEVVAVDGAGAPLRRARAFAPPWADRSDAQQVFRLVPVATAEPVGPLFPWHVGGAVGLGRFHPRAEADAPELLGRLELAADPPLHVALTCYQGVLAEELVLAGATRVTFVLDAATLEGRLAGLRFHLVDPSGSPVAHDAPTLWAPGAFGVPLRIGPGGSNAWTGLPPGEYALVWLAQGLRRSFALVPGETLDLGAITLERRHALRGRVRLADGGTPPLAPHDAVDAQDFPRFAFGQAGAWPGEIGMDDSFRVQAGADGLELELLPDRYTLQWRSGRLATQPFTVDLGAGDATLELVARELAPLVIEPVDDPGAFGVRVLDARGLELERVPFVPRRPVRLELVPGPLRVVAAGAGGRTRSERFTTLEAGGARVRW